MCVCVCGEWEGGKVLGTKHLCLVVSERVFPPGFKVRVPGTPLCGVKESFNKI